MELHKVMTEIMEKAYPLLNSINDNAESEVVKDGWSKKEIIGHLIDSAINNRARFVRFQIDRKLRFDGYVQDEWVAKSGYKSWTWHDLIEGWYLRNKELSRIISLIPTEILEQKTQDHNLHLVAFKKVPEGVESSLSYFITDYICHMEHHIKQVAPSYDRVIAEY